MQKKDDTLKILAPVLIAVGFLWLFRQAGHFPFFMNFHFYPVFSPFRHIFADIGNILFSWKIILILTGVVMIAGRRSAGIIPVVIGVFLLLPELLHLSFMSLSYLLPALLIGAGVFFILKASQKINS